MAACQFVLTFALAMKVLFGQDNHVVLKYPISIFVFMARFISVSILHYLLQDELKKGLDMMKFSLNHNWKFKKYQKAW